jgi:hypothetical protein
VGTLVGFGFLVGLGLGVWVSEGVRLGLGDLVGEDVGVLVIGWNGVSDGFSVAVIVDVEKMLEITRGGSGRPFGMEGKLDTVIQPRVMKLSNPNNKDFIVTFLEK